MESVDVYKNSYKNLEKAIKANLTGNVSIDYSKFDETTASSIRLALSRVLGERKREVWKVICDANADNIAKL